MRTYLLSSSFIKLGLPSEVVHDIGHDFLPPLLVLEAHGHHPALAGLVITTWSFVSFLLGQRILQSSKAYPSLLVDNLFLDHVGLLYVLVLAIHLVSLLG